MAPAKRKRSWGTDLHKLWSCLVLVVSIMGANPAHAVIASCSTPLRFSPNGSWILQNPTTFQAGTPLASIDLVLPISVTNFRVAATPTAIDQVITFTGNTTSGNASYPNFNTTWNTVPVAGVPSIGGRLTLTSAAATGLDPAFYTSLPAVFTPTMSPPDLVYFMKRIPSGVQRVSSQLTYMAKYELIILDPVAYASVDPAQILLYAQKGPQMSLFISAMADNDSNDKVQAINCFNGTNSSNTLAALPAVPPLPKDMATCKFDAGSLNQTVTLNPTNQSQVAAQGDARTAGAVGENTFNLIASACSKGATYSVYFTDARQTGSQQNYLTPDTGKQVGVRLYQGAETQPITFGPAPIGSSLPPQAPLRYGSSAAAANASYTMPFTAQYVRLPGVLTAPAGSVAAQATVTIVYP